MWLRHAKSLRDDEEEMVHVCELEARRNLSDIKDEHRSTEDLRDCHVCREGNTNYHMGNEMGSKDLIDYQEGNREIPIC